MILWRRGDNLRGADDWIAEIALARRALQRQLADELTLLCRRRFTHPRWPAQRDANGYLVIETCVCALPVDHGGGHNIERRVYRVDADGREHYATRPVVMAAGPWPRT